MSGGSVHIQNAAGSVLKVIGFRQTCRSRFANAEQMGRHGEKASDLRSLQLEGETNGPGFQQLKAWQRRDGVFLLVGQFFIQNGFQTQQMIFCGQHLEKQSVPAKDPAEFLRQRQGE